MLYFRLLGPVTVEHGGEPVRLGGPQARGVLAALLLRAGQVVPVDELSALLWGDTPPASCRVQIQGLVSGLRRALGASPDPIVTQAPGYLMNTAGGRIDLEEFRRELSAARRHLADGEHGPAADLLRTALARWRGHACSDLPYDPIRKSAIAIDELHTAALECRIDAEIGLGADIGAGAGDELISELTALTDRHPLRERFRGQLMTVLARAGRPEDALAVYQDARKALVEELGIEPSEELRDLQHSILTGAGAAGVIPRQLPVGPPILAGRSDLLDEAARTLRGRPACLALTGPGGVGKTAVALRLAHSVRPDFPDGQMFARLGGTAPESVLQHFLRALGVPPDEVPRDAQERAALFRTLLSSRRLLIVLDDVADETSLRPLIPAADGSALIATSRRRLEGIEHLRPLPVGVLPPDAGMDLLKEIVGDSRVEAEPDAAADVVRHCGGLPLALRIAGGRLASRPNWTVRHMATRLAGVRDRLDWLHLGDLDVRAGIAETYSGLSDDQQRLFRLLGLLEGHAFPGWLPAALLDRSGVALSDASDILLEDLAEVHLVEPAGPGLTGPRYRMHDLVRLVARELALDIDSAAERRSASHRVAHGWLSLAVAADSRLPHWIGLDSEPAPQWHPPDDVRDAVRGDPWAWFDEAWGALAGVVRDASDQGIPEVAWPLAQRLSTYLEIRGRNDEWVDVLTAGLHAAEEAGDAQGQATMLGLLLHATSNRDNYDTSLRYGERTLVAYRALEGTEASGGAVEEPASPVVAAPPDVAAREKALAAARHCDDPLAVAFAAARLIFALRVAGRNGDYLGLFEEARDGFRAGGIPLLEAWSMKYIGLIYCRRGRFAEAAECMARAMELLRDFDEEAAAAFAGRDLAGFAAAHGRIEAEEMALEALEQAEAVGDQWSIGRSLMTLGKVATARDDHGTARAYYRDALAVWRALNVPSKAEQVLTAIGDSEGGSVPSDPVQPTGAGGPSS